MYASGLNSLEMFGSIGECKKITKVDWKVFDGKAIKAFSGYQHIVVLTSDGHAYAAGEHISEQTQTTKSIEGYYPVLPEHTFTAVGGGYHNTILIYDERMKKKDRRFALLLSAQYHGYLSDIDIVRN
jgi:alpha-tubulin suppressor-like RCC1 family protein